MAMLPPGYPADACHGVDPAAGLVAAVECAANVDPGGPTAATYRLAADRTALTTAFGRIVRAATVVTCPGNIQSPGPWRRNAAPQAVAGTLFCGFAQSSPTVAWTDDARLLVVAVRSDPPGPDLAQLYAWWSMHS
jgi:hypothetical protein